MTTSTDPIAAAGIVITATQTTPSRPGKAPRPVWNVYAPPAYVDLMYRLGARKYGRTFSFWSDPTAQIAEALAEGDAALSFAERQRDAQLRAAERADRYEGYATNAERRSEQGFERAHEIMRMIPPGQPILIGHHSERHARADQKRIDNGIRKGIEEGKKADHWQHRAAVNEVKAAGTHPIDFIQRRIDEAAAEVRAQDRYLDPAYRNYDGQPASDASRAFHQRLRDEYADRLAYWQAGLEAAGGVKFGPDSIKKGDQIKARGRWRLVLRVSPKTVTAEYDLQGVKWPSKVPYAEITEHRPAEAGDVA